MSPKTLSLFGKWSLAKHLFFLIGQNWNPAEALDLAEVREKVGDDLEERLLGERVLSTRHLFCEVLCKLVGQVDFRKTREEDLEALKQDYTVDMDNSSRWYALRTLLLEISENWDEDQVAEYELGISFDEVVHHLAGLRFFK